MSIDTIEIDDTVAFKANGQYGPIEDRGVVVAAYKNGIIKVQCGGNIYKLPVSNAYVLSKGDC